MKNYNNITAVIFTFICIVTAFAATIPNEEQPPQFKNLKVLPKNITEAALDKIMDDFNYSLGVSCDYCHTKANKADELNFASDTKSEKSVARKMMLMTYDINIKHFGGTKDRIKPQTIKCITCHRQKPYPETDSTGIKK
jgi:Photosynthetic reaction centre cytochrome C subunit